MAFNFIKEIFNEFKNKFKQTSLPIWAATVATRLFPSDNFEAKFISSSFAFLSTLFIESKPISSNYLAYRVITSKDNLKASNKKITDPWLPTLSYFLSYLLSSYLMLPAAQAFIKLQADAAEPNGLLASVLKRKEVSNFVKKLELSGTVLDSFNTWPLMIAPVIPLFIPGLVKVFHSMFYYVRLQRLDGPKSLGEKLFDKLNKDKVISDDEKALIAGLALTAQYEKLEEDFKRLKSGDKFNEFEKSCELQFMALKVDGIIIENARLTEELAKHSSQNASTDMLKLASQ
jgi:hypothetical protein